MTAEEVLKTKPNIKGAMNDVLFEWADVLEAMQEYADQEKDNMYSEEQIIAALEDYFSSEWLTPYIKSCFIQSLKQK